MAVINFDQFMKKQFCHKSEIEDFRLMAESLAQEELEDFYVSYSLFCKQLKNTVLFKDIDMETISDSILSKVNEKYFDNNNSLKDLSSIREFRDKYSKRIICMPEREDYE